MAKKQKNAAQGEDASLGEKDRQADRQALLAMATIAAGARSKEFAASALKGLREMGFDPGEAVFEGFTAERYGREKVNFLQELAFYGPPGAPMLRALLESGADPEAGTPKGGLTPLMAALHSGNPDAAVALALAGADWVAELTSDEPPRFMKDHGQTPWEMCFSRRFRTQVWSPKDSWSMSEEEAKQAWLRAVSMATAAIKGDPAKLAQGLDLVALQLVHPLAEDESGVAQAFQILVDAGADPTALAKGCARGGLVEGASSAAQNAAALSWSASEAALLEMQNAFGSRLDGQKLLAAMGAGLGWALDRGLEGAFFGPLHRGRAQALAGALARFDPTEKIETAAGESRSFASQLGRCCQPFLLSPGSLKSALGFVKAWLSCAKEQGATFSAEAFANELALGAASRSTGGDWPSAKAMRETLKRVEIVLRLDPKLERQLEMALEKTVVEWALSGERLVVAGKLEEGDRSQIADFVDQVGEMLSKVKRQPQGDVDRCWRALGALCERAASLGASDRDRARLEKTTLAIQLRGERAGGKGALRV